METRTWDRIRFGTRLRIVFIAILIFVVANAYRPTLASERITTFAPINTSVLLEGLDLTPSITAEDTAYLRDGLQFLRDHVPDWYTYVAETKPLTLSIDLSEGKRGLAAKSKCCDERGYGSITFGEHFDSSTDEQNQSSQTKQIAFLSVLIHETTHIHDRREGRITAEVDYAACVTSERAAFTQEVEFKRAVVSVIPAIRNELDRAALEKQIVIEASALEGTAVNLYCLPLAVRSSE